jgi:uncharacterized membrane protein
VTFVNWQSLILWWPSHWMRLFWVAVMIVVVRFAVRWFRISVAHSKSLPEQVLRVRYVSGEIDKSEYESKLRELHRFVKSEMTTRPAGKRSRIWTNG